jgi:hypothetical protein
MQEASRQWKRSFGAGRVPKALRQLWEPGVLDPHSLPGFVPIRVIRWQNSVLCGRDARGLYAALEAA